MKEEEFIEKEGKTQETQKEENTTSAQEKKKGKVWRSQKNASDNRKRKRVVPNTPITDKAMERLAQLMNDSPTRVKLKDTEWEIRGLRPGAQWMIAEEACKIVKGENMAMGDVLKQFAINMPSVCRCMTIALLNDKKRIESDEFQKVYDTLMWGDYEMRDWTTLLFEIINLVDVNFFFASTGVIQTVRTILNRKTTATERQLYPPVQNGGK